MELNLSLSGQQRLLQESLAKLLSIESTTRRVRAAESLGLDLGLWEHLTQFGLPTMRAMGNFGGGASLFDSVLAAEECGRYLASAPVAETLAAGWLLSQLGESAAPWLERASKGTVVTLALHEGRSHPTQVVPAGKIANAILLLEGDEIALLTDGLMDRVAGGMVSTPIAGGCVAGPGLSHQREVLAKGAKARHAFLAAVEEWKLDTAASLIGIGAAALELAAAYSRDRKTFGRPIGTYQGISHPMADSAVDIEGGRLLVWQAVDAIAMGASNAGALVSMAFWWATQAADLATTRALRTFGGYGVSLEYDIQLYYRRCKSVGLVAGDPELELLRGADRLWLGEQAALPEAGDIGISFDWGETARAYADELRQFVEENVDSDLRARFHHASAGVDRGFHRKLAAEGHLFPDVPENAGIKPRRSRYEALAASELWEEMDWTDVHIGITEFVLRMELEWGTEAARLEIVPAFLRGEALGCLGFTESQSGSDIFGAQLRAIRNGSDWVINGEKVFTTCAEIADYIMLLTRTNPGLARHHGLTIFIAPLNVSGVKIHSVLTLQDERTNIVSFTDVRVHDRYRLGEVDNGIAVMHSALKIEHGGLFYHHVLRSMLRHAETWAKTVDADGAQPIDNARVRLRLARAFVNFWVSEGLAKRNDWAESSGYGSIAFGPMSKLFATESLMASASDIVALAAPQSLLSRQPDLWQVESAMRRAIGMTIYGGTSEIHRSLIAEHFLKMPKTRG